MAEIQMVCLQETAYSRIIGYYSCGYIIDYEVGETLVVNV